MSVGLWILIGLGTAGSLLLLALVVPVDLRLRVAREERIEAKVQIEWLFGLVRKDVSGGHEAAKPVEPKEDAEPRPSLRTIWQSGLLQRGCSLTRKLKRAVSIREIHCHGLVNAGDPYETGTAFALIGPVAGLLAALPHTDILVSPDFGDDIGVRGELRGHVRIIPVMGLVPLVAFLLSPATWRGLRRLRRRSEA